MTSQCDLLALIQSRAPCVVARPANPIRAAAAVTVWLVVLLASAACGGATEPQFLPDGAVRFETTAAFPELWREVETCAGQSDTAKDAVQWFEVPNAEDFLVPGHAGRYAGFWFQRGPTIVVAGAWRADPYALRHEMLHEVLRRPDHPAEYFQRRCRDFVVCTATCQADSLPSQAR